MSSEWRPDDSLMEQDEKGRSRGAQRVIDALTNRNVRYGNEVLTSRDKRVVAVQRDLKRTGMLPGVEQWQIPMVFRPTGDVLSFLSRMKPGVRVPAHSHEFGVARIVVGGSLVARFVTEGSTKRVTLKVGDWMFVPAGLSYALQAGLHGCIVFYHHGPCIWPFAARPSVSRSARR